MSDKFFSRRLPQRTKARFKRVAFAVAALLIMALTTSSSFWALPPKPPPVKPAEDLPSGTMQAKATTSCLECHEARIILQQRLSKAAWTKEVDKMVKWGALLDTADRDALIDYLSTNFSPDQPPYEPPKSAVQKSAVRKGK
jgi:hypothetical protein